MDDRRVRLLERADELQELRALAEQAATGRGAVAVVEGPAGIGKSSVLGAVREIAAATGLQAQFARAGLLERDLSWNVVRQLFAGVVRASPERRAEVLAGAAGLAAAALGLTPDGQSAADETGGLHGLYWLITELAEAAPVLLAIDDAHWADTPSLRYLAYLGERIMDLPLLIVVTVRTGEHQEPPLQALGSHAAARRIALRALSTEATSELTRDVLGRDAGEAFCSACHTASGGNPFILHELLAQLARDRVPPSADRAADVALVTPEGVTRSVLLRLSLLSSEAREMASTVAVLGVEVGLRDAAAIAGQDPAVAASAADALVTAGILAPGASLRFVHPLVREVVYAELPDHERARRHQLAARRLSDAGADPGRVAVQLLQTEPGADPWVVAELREAARTASAEGARQPAAQFLRRALAEPPAPEDRVDVLHELAAAESLSGSASAIEHLQEAYARAHGSGREARIGLELMLMLFRHGQMDDALALGQTVLNQVAEDDDALRLRVIAAAVTGGVLVPALRPRVEHFLQRIPEALAGDTPEERLALSARLASALVEQSPMDVVADLGERALGDGMLLADLSSHELLYWNAASALVVADRFGPARAAIESAFEDSRRYGSIVGYALSSCFSCLLSFRIGEIANGAADGRQALAMAGPHEFHIHAYAAAFLLDCLIECGELEEALALATSPPFGGDLPAMFVFHALRVARGRLRIELGDHAAGVQEILAVGEAMIGADFGPAICPWRSRAVPGLMALGRHAEARALAEADLEVARRTRSGWAEAVALQACALADPDRDRAVERLDAALHGARAGGFALEHARALVLLGSLHRRAGRRTVAGRLLRAGLEESERCGALALEERARTELAPLGVRPRRSRTTGAAALTASERRVADLAVSGLANREIAQALFVSLRTVETHLTHCYQKLGIESRAQLPVALAEVPGSR